MALQHQPFAFTDRYPLLLRKEGAKMRDSDHETETGIAFWIERLERRLRPAIDSFGNSAVSDRWEGLRVILASKLSGFQASYSGDKAGDIFEYLVVFVPYWIGRHLGVAVSEESVSSWFDQIEPKWDSESIRRFTSKETSELTETITKLFPLAGQRAARSTQPQRSYKSKGRR